MLISIEVFSEYLFNRYSKILIDRTLESKLVLYKYELKKSKIVILGDSKMGTGVNPEIIKKITGESSVNLAAPRLTLISFYRALKSYKLLNTKRIFILNIDLYHINDKSYDVLDPKLNCLQMNLFERLSVYKFNYPNILFYCLLEVLYKKSALSKIRTFDMNSDKYNGFSPLRSSVPMSEIVKLHMKNGRPTLFDSYLESPQLMGVKNSIFKKIFSEFGKTNDKFIIVIMPIPPAWYNRMEKTQYFSNYNQFKNNLEAQIKYYPNISLLDWQNPALIQFEDNDFADILHLNEQGANRLTRKLVNENLGGIPTK